MSQQAAWGDAQPAGWQRAVDLYQQGKHGEALQAVQQFRGQLPAPARLARWRIDFPDGGLCRSALVGQKHVYYMWHNSRVNPHAPRELDAGPLVNDTTMRYDFNVVIACVDGATGKHLWTRQTAGQMELAVDPGSDDLYCWRGNKVFRISAAKGVVVLEKDIPKAAERVSGLTVDGRVLMHRRRIFSDDDREPIYGGDSRNRLLFNVASGELAKIDVLRPERLAPDEKRALRVAGLDSRTIFAESLQGKVLSWKYEHLGHSLNDPLWVDNDVIALNGFPDSKAEVVRLNGGTGKVVWRFPLPRGACVASRQAELDSGYWHHDWDAISTVADRLLAIGGEGTLYFLDPKAGRLESRTTPSAKYLAFPRVIDQHLILCTPAAIQAVPVGLLLDRKAPDERDAALLEVRCLAALGQTKEALSQVRSLLDQFPEFHEAWSVRAELARKAGLPYEELAARCNNLEQSQQDNDPVLRAEFGLVRRIATGNDITAPPVRLRDSAYIGTLAGWLYEIDLRSLDVMQKKEQPSAIRNLFERQRLWAFLDNAKEDLLTELGPWWDKPPDGPAEWHNVDGYAGRVVRYRGNHYRPVGGGIRVLAGGTMREYPSKLAIESWNIHIGPNGPIGYGTGGVYELDKNLCPVRRTIDVGKDKLNQRPFYASWLATDGNTIALVTRNDDHHLLQVWTADGKQVLREERLLAMNPRDNDPTRLMSVAGGYLFCGCELLWVPQKAGVPIRRLAARWRMQPNHLAVATPYLYRPDTMLFSGPVLTERHLLVTGSDGAVYVFDTARFTRE